MSPWVTTHCGEIRAIARKHGMTNVRVFGSMARDTARADSDLDLLVDYEEGAGLFDQIAFEQELEERLNLEVDVATPQSLHWYIRNAVMAEAQPL